MTREFFNKYINQGNFSGFFIELGWNHPENRDKLSLQFDGEEFLFLPVAEKSGFHVYCCEVSCMPNQGLCKKIDTQLRWYGYDYICIFRQRESNHDLWLIPIKTDERRELVKLEYENASRADFLCSKVDSISFPLTQRVFITDVKNKVVEAFRMNSEEITKTFYKQFKKQHDAFAAFIQGVDNINHRNLYTSVMLNRLMFCYFIQKKGFLDDDKNYLRNKLKWVKEEKEGGSFYASFYKGFLCVLFHDGLNAPNHDTQDFRSVYGRIPYLNGGMFDIHRVEREFPCLDIADEAFEKLFDFFDKWHWHLDTRLTSSGKDINPDVLGFIFEQYINDRARMGAYYTKEDITEYIAKNCIIPFLMDKVSEKIRSAFKTSGEIWELLKNSGDRYIYPNVKKGYSPDWKKKIPTSVSIGLDTISGDLFSRRVCWNDRSDKDISLPTEIWRETVERFQYCDSLVDKIQNGQLHNINDFITYNLDIRQFIADVISKTRNHRLVGHFYHAIRNITVLDPTCGSGAFLFAALNVLEPLYELCLDRMEEFHASNPGLFSEDLEEIRENYNSNREYFIYKSIILRNLYGVDIMNEATEIAKLRLFLKLVAVVEVNRREPNLGLDPLPNVDFNIKCGNSLVGFTSEMEISEALATEDMFARAEYEESIGSELPKVAAAFQCFQEAQLRAHDNDEDILNTKNELKSRLSSLNNLFNKFLYAFTARGVEYETWRENTLPFHWISEFYQILHQKGGFDVVIGNPPYLESEDIDYEVSSSYLTYSSKAVHAWCIERSLRLSHGNTSMIVPMALTSTQRMRSVQRLLENGNITWYSNFAWRPAKLFDDVNRAFSIYITRETKSKPIQRCYTTNYIKWTADNRQGLFNLVRYTECDTTRQSYWVPKLQGAIDRSILRKILKFNNSLPLYTVKNSGSKLYYRSTGGLYWKIFTNFPPFYERNGVIDSSSRQKTLCFSTNDSRDAFIGLFSSNLYWMWYTITSNLRDLNPADLQSMRFPSGLIENHKLSELGRQLVDDLQLNSTICKRNQKTKGIVKAQSFVASRSKKKIDMIDAHLANFYAFSEEEVDFIINYDIKYRMGEQQGDN